MEYVLAHRGPGRTIEYELVFDGRGREGQPTLPGLIDPHPGGVEDTTPTSTTEPSSGVEGRSSGPRTPTAGSSGESSGPDRANIGPSSPPENYENTPENPSKPPDAAG